MQLTMHVTRANDMPVLAPSRLRHCFITMTAPTAATFNPNTGHMRQSGRTIVRRKWKLPTSIGAAHRLPAAYRFDQLHAAIRGVLPPGVADNFTENRPELFTSARVLSAAEA